METTLNHLEIFEDFCKENHSLINWFKKIMFRKNSHYIVSSFVPSNIIKLKWNGNNCTLSLNYDRWGSTCITISKKGIELTNSTLPEDYRNIAIKIFNLYGLILNNIKEEILIASYKDGNPFEE